MQLRIMTKIGLAKYVIVILFTVLCVSLNTHIKLNGLFGEPGGPFRHITPFLTNWAHFDSFGGANHVLRFYLSMAGEMLVRPSVRPSTDHALSQSRFPF